MDELPKRRIWLPSVDVLVFLGVGMIITALCIPALLSSERASHERNASTSLKTLTSAEADFRANDRDGNKVNDFWTGDVSGLYHVKSPDTNLELRLIEGDVARADAKPLFPISQRAVGGYFYQALDRDDNLKGPDGDYKQDTDKSGRKVHNTGSFGFCAYPRSGSDGKYIFFVNENSTIFRWEGTQPRSTFPNDQILTSFWSRMASVLGGGGSIGG